MDSRQLPGSLKVAILVKSMGKEIEQKVLGTFSRQERDIIEGHMSQLDTIAPDVIETIAGEFIRLLKNNHGSGALSARGNEGGRGMSKGEDGSSQDSEALMTLNAMDPEQLTELIKEEHPQTVAIILVHLKAATAGEVLARLPEAVRSEVAVRVANMDKVVSGMIEEIDDVFAHVLKNNEKLVSRKTGGVGRLADILNQIDAGTAELVLSDIEESTPELAEQIKALMFVFEDLVLVDDRGLQKVLRRVETKDLSIALKAGSDEVKQKVFRNMSERAREMLAEEIDELGPVRMKEVEDAQQVITKIIQSMEEKGEIVINGRGGEELI